MKAPNLKTYIALALNWLLRWFFMLLYNQFAWTYDWVARIVSLGLWNEWISSVIPFLKGEPILEIGHGTGHLQLKLSESRSLIFGVDISSSMGKIARKRLQKGNRPTMLVRGTTKSIPFPNNTFTSIVATFPSEYIANRQTLEESWRILQADGRLVILPYAWTTGERWFERLTGWLFRITNQAPRMPKIGEAPPRIFGEWVEVLVKTLEQLGFLVSFENVFLKSSKVLIIIAEKNKFPANV